MSHQRNLNEYMISENTIEHVNIIKLNVSLNIQHFKMMLSINIFNHHINEQNALLRFLQTHNLIDYIN